MSVSKEECDSLSLSLSLLSLLSLYPLLSLPLLSLSPPSLSLYPLLTLSTFALSTCVCCSVQEELEMSSSVTSRLEEMRKTGGDKWLSLLNSGARNSASPIIDDVSHTKCIDLLKHT